MKWLKWEPGRQGSGYLKLKLLESKRFKFDLYLLKYPTDSYITWHYDPAVANHNHWRMNIVLKESEGGKFLTLTEFGSYEVESDVHIQTRFLNIFRPDVTYHSVSKVTKGTRYVLSLGWLTKNSYLASLPAKSDQTGGVTTNNTKESK